MPESIVIRFQHPDKLLNMNDRMHWSAYSKRVREWRSATFWHAKAAMSAKQPPPGKAFIRVVFGTPQPTRRRDPHNYFPTVKAIIDGLTDAKLWPDDSAEYVGALEPAFTLDKNPIPSCTVEVYWS